jgi:spermidine synthase
MRRVNQEKFMPVRPVPKQAFFLVAGAAFSAGALAIALEMILMRLATRYTGSAADGTTTALTVYLLGLLAGAALILRLNNKKEDHLGQLPVLMLILLGLLVAGLGYLSRLPSSSLWLEQFCGGLPFCVVLILVPACIVGTIFPLLLLLCTRFYFGSRESFMESDGEIKNFNNKVILLYLISNLGSALGALGGAIWLLPRLGIAESLNFVGWGWALAAILLAPFAVAMRKSVGQEKKETDREKAARDSTEAEAEPEAEVESINIADAVVTSSQPFTYMCVFFAALAGLVFECLSIRMLALLCGASFITTACAVAATLLAIALGTRISLFLPTNKNTRLTLALALSLAASGVALLVILLPHLNNVFQAVRQLTLAEFSETGRHVRWLAYLYPRLVLALIFCLPGATGLSLVFPVAARGASRPLDMLRLYIAGGLGTALAPIVFLASVGHTFQNMPSSMELMLRIIVILLIALAIVALLDRRLRGKKAREAIFTKVLCLGAIASALAVLFIGKPLAVSQIDMGLTFVSPDLSVRDVEKDAASNARLFYKEGRTATVSVFANEQNNSMSLRSDGKVEGSVPINFDAPAMASDLPTQSLLALLPLVWHTEQAKAQSCFLIGFGTGTTAATIAKASPTVKLTVVEIEPAVLEAGKCFKQNAEIVLPTALTTGDARHILQASPATFDLIISQPAEPWVQGSTNLYSSEFYQLVRSRLNKGGIFSQWLQLYGIDEHGMASALATFQTVFPNSLVFHSKGAGEVIVLGFNQDQETNDRALSNQAANDRPRNNQRLQQNFLLPANRKLLARAGIDSFETLQEGLLLTSDRLRQAVKEWQSSEAATQVTDDNLALEVDSLPEIESAARPIQTNLALLKKWATLP